ncbi:MAG TPA: FkbM family methyltransferase [Rhodopila sp.]
MRRTSGQGKVMGNGSKYSSGDELAYTTRWRNSRGRALMEGIAYPLAYLINRPTLQPLGRLLYDFALRCNGIGIAFAGKSGLTIAEERFLKNIAKQLRKATILDVGANHGDYASAIKRLAPDSTVYAFEPHPKNFAALKTAADNSNFTAVPLAVSNISGTVELYDFADQDGSTQASLGMDTIAFHNSASVSHKIQCTTLDDFVSGNNIGCIDLLKIDTEGFDLRVLQGGEKTIRAGIAKLIQFEIIPADIVRKVTVKDFFDILPKYDLYRLCLNGDLLPMRSYSVKECEIYVTHNIIAKLRE